MAEIENTDGALENSPLDEDSLNISPKKSSKPMNIKIYIIGFVALLLIACGVYFFIVSSDKPVLEEASSEMDEKIVLPEIVIPESTEVKNDGVANTTESSAALKKEESAEHLELIKMREQTAVLKEENLKIKEQLKKLEAQQIADLAATKTKAVNSKITSKSTETKNPYANLYIENDPLIRPLRRKQPQEPVIELAPPEPKWGDFDPLYSGK